MGPTRALITHGLPVELYGCVYVLALARRTPRQARCSALAPRHSALSCEDKSMIWA